jgi:hypothetical protein
VKVLEYADFEELPRIFHKKCDVIDTTLAQQSDCELFYGWLIDGGKIDSGIGIAPGIRQSIVLQAHIMDETHGNLEIEYQTYGFTSPDKKERLIIFIDGEERYSVTDDTAGKTPSLMKFYLEEKLHKIEIAFESRSNTTNLGA